MLQCTKKMTYKTYQKFLKKIDKNKVNIIFLLEKEYKAYKGAKHIAYASLITSVLCCCLCTSCCIRCASESENVHEMIKACLEYMKSVYKDDINNVNLMNALFKDAIKVIEKSMVSVNEYKKMLEERYEKYTNEYSQYISNETRQNLRKIRLDKSMFDYIWTFNQEQWPEQIVKLTLDTIRDLDHDENLFEKLQPLKWSHNDKITLQAALPLMCLLMNSKYHLASTSKVENVLSMKKISTALEDWKLLHQ